MSTKNIENVTIIGAGTMGHSIGLVYALGGCRVTLHDRSLDILRSATPRIESNLETLVGCGVVSPGAASASLSRLTVTTDFKEAVHDCDFVTEAVTENADIKRAVFGELDVYCPEQTILASNTSSLMIRDFASQCKRQDRILLTHWVNPAHVAPVVEVVAGERTSCDTIDTVFALLKKVKKEPVRILEEIPGLVHNRIQAALIREVWALWARGIASAEDIDTVVKHGFGLRLAVNGPLETADFGGLDVWYASSAKLFTEISKDEKPPEKLRRMVELGELGVKTGKGFFDYDGGSLGKEQNNRTKERDKRLLNILKMNGFFEEAGNT